MSVDRKPISVASRVATHHSNQDDLESGVRRACRFQHRAWQRNHAGRMGACASGGVVGGGDYAGNGGRAQHSL